MRTGMRKPSLKKSISARATGSGSRALKKFTTPAYGKKGAGLIRNPSKSVYNRVYSRTTSSISHSPRRSPHKASNGNSLPSVPVPQIKRSRGFCVMLLVISIILCGMSLLLCLALPVGGIAGIVLGVWGIVSAIRKIQPDEKTEDSHQKRTVTCPNCGLVVSARDPECFGCGTTIK